MTIGVPCNISPCPCPFHLLFAVVYVRILNFDDQHACILGIDMRRQIPPCHAKASAGPSSRGKVWRHLLLHQLLDGWLDSCLVTRTVFALTDNQFEYRDFVVPGLGDGAYSLLHSCLSTVISGSSIRQSPRGMLTVINGKAVQINHHSILTPVLWPVR
jgi:hypothetical protein